MNRGRFAAVALVCASFFVSPVHGDEDVGDVQLMAPDGSPVLWQEWLDERAPVALLFWASWAPRSKDVLASVADLSASCAKQELKLVVIDVHEPLSEARQSLSGQHVQWLHDRHGALLKAYRAIRVPSLLVVDSRGKVLAELDATAEAVNSWRAR